MVFKRLYYKFAAVNFTSKFTIMKMTLLLALTLSVTATVYAEPTTTVIKPRLHAVELPRQERRGAETARRIRALATQKAPGRFDFDDKMPVSLSRVNGGTKTHRLDEILITQGEEEYARQRFEYFNNGLSHLRINEFRESNSWNPIEEYGYEWDEDGYCLKQWGRSLDGMSDMMNEFRYNDRKMGIEKIISYYSDNVWTPSEKGEYTYDDNNNIIDETVSMYDPDTRQWMPVMRNKATWSPEGLQTSFETYNWNGTGWEPGDDKAVYKYDADGHVTLYGFSLWNGEDWTYYYRVRQEFENGNIILQTDEYFNPDENDWTGCYAWKGWPLYSRRTNFTYDEEGCQSGETTYMVHDISKGWEISAYCTFEYTPLDNGGVRMQRDMYLTEAGDDIYDILVKEYDRAGNATFIHEKQNALGNGTLIDIFEESYQFLDEKYLQYGETYVYSQDEENVKTAETHEEYDYDDARNVIESRHELGNYLNFGEGDPLEFRKFSMFTYAYDNVDVRTEKLAYLWNGGAYDPNWGDGVEYDFNIPAANCIVWQDLKMDYTIMKTIQYTGDGGEWSAMTSTYSYTPLGNGIDNIEDADNSISFSPNPVTDIMHINVTGEASTEIFDLNGSLLINSDNHDISLAGLLPGMYLARINGKTFRVIKR